MVDLGLIDNEDSVITECLEYLSDLSFLNIAVSCHDHIKPLSPHALPRRRTCAIRPVSDHTYTPIKATCTPRRRAGDYGMSAAPQELLAARALALDHLDMNPGRVHSDLDPAEVGIVGDTAHEEGGDSYHLGKDKLRANARYSVKESSRDSRPDIYAAGLDIGEFSRGRANLRHFSLWLVGHCRSGTSWTKNIREVIYSPDGKTVKRWDRLGKRSTGDDSHTWHTHISFFRDSHGRGALEMIRQYLYEVGLLERPAQSPIQEEEDMPSPYGGVIPLPQEYACRSTGAGTTTPIDKGKCLALPFEPAGFDTSVWGDRLLALSLFGDFANESGPELVRVAIYDGAGWNVGFYEVRMKERVDITVPPAKSGEAYGVSIARVLRADVDTEDPTFQVPPVGLCWTIV